ncbi:MAG: hypothetical protein M1839_006588 [Geoglossum umbratile]|nr:MAG: hypothetical protein M1839_006588 [Geoglossum umbratile]
MPGTNVSPRPTKSVWQQMNYAVPRGRCNYKPSLLTSSCPCLRFMTHPLHAATSFECDGCGHHASFHMLVNKEEDEVVARWKAEAEAEAEKEKERRDAASGSDTEPARRRPAKRVRTGGRAAQEKPVSERRRRALPWASPTPLLLDAGRVDAERGAGAGEGVGECLGW